MDKAGASSLRDVALLQLLYDSGYRVSELIALSLNSLIFQKSRNSKELDKVYLVGKGNKGRTVSISPLTASHVKEYLKRYGGDLNGNDLFFLSKKGEPLTRGGVAYILSKYVGEARGENPKLFPSWHITPHTLCHSRATHWLAEGVPLEKIRDLLGHRFISTKKIYAKVVDKDKMEPLSERTIKRYRTLTMSLMLRKSLSTH